MFTSAPVFAYAPALTDLDQLEALFWEALEEEDLQAALDRALDIQCLSQGGARTLYELVYAHPNYQQSSIACPRCEGQCCYGCAPAGSLSFLK